MNTFKIQNILCEMEEILSHAELTSWAIRIRSINNLISTQPVEAKSEIFSLFGGMGSLSDVILYKDGHPLLEENNRLQILRENLYSETHTSP